MATLSLGVVKVGGEYYDVLLMNMVAERQVRVDLSSL